MTGSSENRPHADGDSPASRAEGPALLFVYGTLLPGSRIPLADRLQPIEPVRVRGRLYDLGRYPALVLTEHDDDPGAAGWVHGMLCAVPNDTILWHQLDRYEGYDPARPAESEYLRRRTRARTDSGAWRDCWVYGFNQPLTTARHLPDGRWVTESNRG